ncbi:Holliday junction resolvase RuvX [Flavobacterium branchiophilum NBRC 15030 = ATCC 35035]|uniref:Putative pre-16S rRNA nuclease n=1 Tax=Flavobacterium branchiophilum TaxID=55197 RepID=A0A543G7Q1_9FLAO|nr:Holliday junction resolvase RuvX [Flavobacterium branchiophilum]OXA76024.1 Holliday junction resolvase RuvX [Flavobacterium branchiophilum NBRC 15030 = ATCC 35035]TQM42116.1 putative Holliday junction resolvase [Flavobacterium branchiophilum]
MSRILALDYGLKRTGIAVTDDYQLIASGLTTVPTHELMSFLTQYFQTENVKTLVIGDPKQMNGLPSESAAIINGFVTHFKNIFPNIEVVRIDERFTSKMAFKTMIDSGLKKNQRKNKALIDEIAATILLQDFLASK